VIVWLPDASVAMEHDAVPLLIATAPHPASVVVPSVKATVPVGVPDVPETVAVKVTFCPLVDGFGVLLTAAVASSLFTVCVMLLFAVL
jgi:hypothetical protein